MLSIHYILWEVTKSTERMNIPYEKLSSAWRGFLKCNFALLYYRFPEIVNSLKMNHTIQLIRRYRIIMLHNIPVIVEFFE